METASLADESEKRNTNSKNGSYSTWRWVVLVSSFVIQFLVYGFTQSFGVLYPEIIEVYRGSKGETAWIGSISASMVLLVGPLASMLMKRFGYRVTSIIGAIMTSLGTLSSMLAPNIYTLYFTFGVFTGSGNGLLVISGMLAVTDYFRDREATAVGIICAGGGIGLSVYPMLFRLLLDEYTWKMALLVQTGIMLNGIPCGMVLRPAVSAKSTKLDRSVYGLQTLRNGYLILYIIAAIINSFSFYIPLFYLPAHASSLQISDTDGAFLISLHGITSVFSRIFFGWLADRPKVNTSVMYSILPIIEGAVIACIPNMESYWMLVLASVINGTVGTVFVSMATAVLVDVVGVENLPSAFGYWCFSNGVGILIGPPLAGWFYDLTGSYVPAFYLSATLFILSGFMMLIWPLKQHIGGRTSLKRRAIDITLSVEQDKFIEDN